MAPHNARNTTPWQARLWRDIQSDIVSKAGPAIEWKSPEGGMSVDTKGYSDAIKPLLEWIAADEKRSNESPEVWQVRFAIRNSEFRPTYAEVAKFVKKALKLRDLPQENSEAYKPVEAPGPTVMGIPATTVQAAYHGVMMPKRNDIALADVPTHDAQGNLIGEGRRKFLMTMHRMKGGHHPNPEKAPPLFDADELGPMPKMSHEGGE